MNVMEKHCNTGKNLVLLIHGLEGSGADWIQKGGFVKGGNLTERLTRHGISWIAPDLYGHGKFPAQERTFDPADISDDLWQLFLSRSADAVSTLLQKSVDEYGYDRLTLITYSAGCHVGIDLIQRALPIRVDRVFMAAPCPEREYDDEYSLHNNLDCFNGRESCFFAGTADDEVPVEDVRWLFSQIEDERKELLLYETGHSLPEKWSEDAVSRIVP